MRQVARHSLPVACTWAAKGLDRLNDNDLERFRAEVEAGSSMTESARIKARSRLFAVAQICFQLGSAADPPRRGVTERARTPPELAARVAQPAMARELVRYAETIGTVLRPASAYARVKAVRVFCDWLAENHAEVRRLDQIERSAHVEPFLAWTRHRPWRGPNGRGRTISLTQFHHDVVDLRVFFEDIAAWGWSSSPPRRLLFLTDVPRLPEPMPRALPPVDDTSVMAAVNRLEDPFVRTGLVLLRATGMRVGELLELELDCLVDFAGHGTWIRVPVGKLGSDRMVPLEKPTMECLDAWMSLRGRQRALPHPRHRGRRSSCSWRRAGGSPAGDWPRG